MSLLDRAAAPNNRREQRQATEQFPIPNICFSSGTAAVAATRVETAAVAVAEIASWTRCRTLTSSKVPWVGGGGGRQGDEWINACNW